MTRPAATPTTDKLTVTTDTRVACDGGGGALGHPKVWYSLDKGEVTCGYCDRRFVAAPEKAPH